MTGFFYLYSVMVTITQPATGVYKTNNWIINPYAHSFYEESEKVAIIDNNNHTIINPTLFSDWIGLDGNPYGSLEDLLNDLNSLIFNAAESVFTTDQLFSETQSSFINGASIESGFIDYAKYSRYEIVIIASSAGLTLEVFSKANETSFESSFSTPISSTYRQVVGQAPQRFVNIRITNNTGATLTNVSLAIKAFSGGDGANVLSLDSIISGGFQAQLTRSVLSGIPAGSSSSSFYQNVVVNDSGALLTSDYGTEVAQGKFKETVLTGFAFGRNVDIDVSSTPEDIWNGGGLYTGFNCVNAETLEFFSSSNKDTGQLLSSGIATGGSSNTLEDTNATFVSDGVQIGDLIINDTQQFHGVISSVISETEIQVNDFTDTKFVDLIPVIGDVYRIATNTNTGASVCRFFSMLDSNYDEFSEYIIMNGTTPVNSSGTYLRQSQGQVILSGTLGFNNGEITGRQTISTANVTMVMPAQSGETSICCRTVPRGETWIIKSLNVQMARSIGSAGSAGARLQARKLGETFQTKLFPEIQDGQSYQEKLIGGLLLTEFTDIKWNVQFVSDNSTLVNGEFEYFRIKNQ